MGLLFFVMTAKLEKGFFLSVSFMFDHIVILTLEPLKPAIYSILQRYCEGIRYNFVFQKQELQEILVQVTDTSILISFGNGVIVDEEALKKFGAAYNFHPASPSYPGLHPHHFAALHGAETFGAVVHEMTAEVDRGTIVFESSFPVPPGSPWMVYLNRALDETFLLMERFFKTVFEDRASLKPCGAVWGDKTFTRKDFYEAGRVTLNDSKDLLDTKWRALQLEQHEGVLFLDFHGYRFRFEKVIEEGTSADFPTLLRA